MTSELSSVEASSGLACPFTLRVDQVAAMLNMEFPDHPIYDGVELQWFDDEDHGTGMLAFLSRRGSKQVDYYAQPGLRLDPGAYEIGGGIRSWNELDFDVARLRVEADGVDAEVRFTDVEGRPVELRIDDRDGRPRQPAGLLAPVSANVQRPVSLMLVWMPRFDLARATDTRPVVRIDGEDVAFGRLPGARLHGRHLIKYAAPLVVAELNRTGDALADGAGGGEVFRDVAGRVRQVVARRAGHRVELRLDPPLPDLGGLADRSTTAGRWHVEVDGNRLTGGTWSAAREGGDVRVGMDVDERWVPGPLPPLMRIVTSVVPVFRRWPPTYRWRGRLRLGPEPALDARWERTGEGKGRRRDAALFGAAAPGASGEQAAAGAPRDAGRTTTERVVLGLEALLAIAAVGGGVPLITGATDFGEATSRLPFESAAFGGWALLAVNGALPAAAMVAALRRHPLAPLGHVAVGSALTGWVVVQVGFLGWPPNALQWTYFAYGLGLTGLALRHLRGVR